jgi:ribonuclease HII
MPWVIGLDEAGYGPNLGPLVQSAVAARLPEADLAGWQTLNTLIHQAKDKANGRVLIDDSKAVHTGKHGLKKLEHGLAALFGPWLPTLGNWLKVYAAPGVLADLQGEAWFEESEALPLFPNPPDLRESLSELGVQFQVIGVKLFPAPIFNKIVAASDSKATVLTIGLVGLLMNIRPALPDLEDVYIFCDKQGGRNAYHGTVQQAFPDGWVVTELESAEESRYRVESLDRVVKLKFLPRAESASVSVAAASMLAKYLRELCMKQFNQFWASHVKDLQPTAGYPQDAKRFFKEIEDARKKLNLQDDDIWRVR